MNTVNKYFEKLLIEGSEEFELIFRSLLKDYDEDKYYLLEETDVFSEPMLCSFFNSNIILPIDQIITGYHSATNNKINVQSNSKGIVHLPKIGYFYTNIANEDLVLSYLGDDNYNIYFNDVEIDNVCLKKEMYVNDSEIEICISENPSISQFFKDQHEDIKVEESARKSIDLINSAFSLIKEHADFFHEWLCYTLKRIMIFESTQRNSFASIFTLNSAYINIKDEIISKIFFLEEITHQCGHAIFYPISIDRQSFFNYDFNTPMSFFSGIENDDRDVLNAFYSFFPQYYGNYIFDMVLDNGELTLDEKEELIGRFAFRMLKFDNGIAQFDEYGEKIFSEEGHKMFKIFKKGYFDLYNKRKQLFDSKDISGQNYVFDIVTYKKKNSGKSTV